VCAEPGCPDLTVDNRHCQAHKREPWKGTRKRSSRRWERKRQRGLRRDRWQCEPCKREGRKTKATEVDHIVPLSQGGTDDDDNPRAICRDCHKAKTQQEANAARVKGLIWD